MSTELSSTNWRITNLYFDSPLLFKRINKIGGNLGGQEKIPIPDFKELKRQGKKIRMVTAYDYPTAVIIEKTDIEMILVGDSLAW